MESFTGKMVAVEQCPADAVPVPDVFVGTLLPTSGPPMGIYAMPESVYATAEFMLKEFLRDGFVPPNFVLVPVGTKVWHRPLSFDQLGALFAAQKTLVGVAPDHVAKAGE